MQRPIGRKIYESPQCTYYELKNSLLAGSDEEIIIVPIDPGSELIDGEDEFS